MNKNFLTLTIIICFCWSACKKVEKNVADYYPAVKTVSFSTLADGTIVLKGSVMPGNYPVYNVGFCMDTVADARVHVNQAIVELADDNTFTAQYKGLSTVPVYYARAWATNENGIGDGNVIRIAGVQLDTTKMVCRPALSSMLLEGSNNPVQSILYNAILDNSWETEVRCTNFRLDIKFSKYPVTGIYGIAAGSASPGNYITIIYWDANGGSVELTHDDKVYVQEISETVLEVTICHALVNKGFGAPYYITGRFRMSRQ